MGKMADDQNKIPPAFSSKPKAKKEESAGEDLTDYATAQRSFESLTGEALTIDDNTPAPNPQAPADPNAKGPFIKYMGYATLRVITPSEWKDVGIHDMGRKEWNTLNKFKVPKSELTESAIDYCLKTDGRFELVD